MTEQAILKLLAEHYGLLVDRLRPMSLGVGGETYLVQSEQGRFVYKVMEANEMNHPAEEPALCEFLHSRGIPVSEFVRNSSGRYLTPVDARLSHLQALVPGRCFPMNEAPSWFLEESPRLLADIHNALEDYPPLPVGIGAAFFRLMTPERAAESYHRSLEIAEARSDTGIIQDLQFRLEFLERVRHWQFDPARLTCRNSHGDYTVNQILCTQGKINAVIDWTSACTQPVVWELTRSYFYAAPACQEGRLKQEEFRRYVSAYETRAPLNDYDRENLLRLYYYQLAVCDYYSQYLHAPAEKKPEYLQQARFATAVLKNALLDE